MQRLHELADAGIEALQRADADALWVLARRVRETQLPRTVAERQVATDELLAFRYLLGLTRRNLLLLRAACSPPDPHGETGN